MGPGGSIVRWLWVLCGAAAGSYGGRVAAAQMRGEPVEPLLKLDQAAVLRTDVVPGFLAVEIAGRFLKLGPRSAALLAAAAAAAAAFADGPFVDESGDRSFQAAAAEGEAGPVV